jgi:hypothetical protein
LALSLSTLTAQIMDEEQQRWLAHMHPESASAELSNCEELRHAYEASQRLSAEHRSGQAAGAPRTGGIQTPPPHWRPQGLLAAVEACASANDRRCEVSTAQGRGPAGRMH